METNLGYNPIRTTRQYSEKTWRKRFGSSIKSCSYKIFNKIGEHRMRKLYCNNRRFRFRLVESQVVRNMLTIRYIHSLLYRMYRMIQNLDEDVENLY